MIPLDLREVAAACGGTLTDVPDPGVPVTGPVVIDSREARPGSLFVALPGEHVDGHDFVDQAIAAGAVGVLAQRPVGVPAVVVDDPMSALGRVARAALDRLRGVTVVGLTGSSGKTSTKDLLAQVLSVAGPTVAPRESHNNELGVPLTVLAADEQTRFLVVEMGARGPGHIARLCDIAPPRVGVVLNVGLAHAGEFGDRAATAKAKSELVRALPSAEAGGLAVLNADDHLVAAMADSTRARVVTFGSTAGADVRAEHVVLDPAGRPSFDLVSGQGSARVDLRLHGAHHVPNALAAAAAALELGMSPAAVASALSAATARSRWRMEVVDRPDGLTVVNDAYNANPDSVRAGLEALVVIGQGRRTWAVLGEMLELGAASAEEHAAVGRLVQRLGVSRLLVVGEGARGVLLGAEEQGRAQGEESEFMPDAVGALEVLRSQVRPGDVVLVKASRGVGLERVALGLLESVPVDASQGGEA
ncbi:MAG: UDP-N-acetylmuramoyl-tripeptide--D-alanyl-D-alanine ligase [Actinomycetota bacterium]|jgi:UDP-N-acetylmuramoyl-tripeptide--D-alanyl-D-alanine ligase|nr:UDP-N-acetylmuramoyl-tripeptide--D-alanyl-D-alanine ligase [Actinomycetota bacterium]